MRGEDTGETVDLLGVGIGPFNLSLAALADGVPGLTCAFLEQRTEFRWHPGLLIEGAALQVPYLADLVSLVEPTSRWSFVNYLKTRERLFPFYFAERFHIHRREYDAYCRWVSDELASCRFGHRVDAIRWDAERDAFEVGFTRIDEDGHAEGRGRLFARSVVLGVGTAANVPEPLRPLAEDPTAPVWHSGSYLDHRDELLRAGHVTVVGSGQSGAEVFLDLLRARPAGREGLTWLARTPAFAPMEYSKLGLEQFTPDHTRYFHGLPEPVRDRLLPQQWQLYKGVSGDTLGEIHDELYARTLEGGWPDAALTPGVAVHSARRSGGRLELGVSHTAQQSEAHLPTDAVVCATGYAERPLDALLEPLLPYVRRDDAGRPRVDEDHRLVLGDDVGGPVFVQNADRHTHGVGAPDLGLAAWRSAVILNALTGRDVYPLPRRTAFTTFGLDAPAAADSTARKPSEREDRMSASPAPRHQPLPVPSAGSAAVPSADPAAVADSAAAESLLRCWVRENAVPEPADGVLRLDLPASGTGVEVPVDYWSRAGWHRFGPARLRTGTPLATPALAALLAVETTAADPAAVADLTGRVTDSTRRIAQFVGARTEAPEDPAGTTPFLAAEQALICGHPLHPTPKSREGLTDAELGRYSPELRGDFPLHWFAADPSVVAADSGMDTTVQELTAGLAGELRAPQGTVLVPAHPWQARDVLSRPGVRALLDAGLLHDLGPAGPAWSPTSSVRTLYRADAPVMLKFSLGLRITNSRRENLRLELERGMQVHRLLEAGLGEVLRAAHPGFDIVRDPAWLAVDSLDGSPTGLDVVVRDNPFPGGPDAERAVCAAGLVSARPDLPGGRSQLATLVHELAERTGRPVADIAEEWFTRYLDKVVVPVLWLYATYGLGLEAHQQNTLVVLDETGWPVGGRYRDNQGYYFSPARSSALYGWVPDVGRDLGTYVDDEVIDERLAYYVGINNMLGLVGALGSAGLADERTLLQRAGDMLTKTAADHGGRLRLATMLRTEPTLRCKANLLTRVRGMDELTGPLESQSVYVDLANPLAEALR